MKSAILTTVSLTGLLAGAALAQDVAAGDEPYVQNTIVVTVQKREQDLRDVPVAVTALDEAFLEDLGLDEFDAVARFIPGFEVQEQSPNNPGFVIRGITSDSGEANIEPRIAVFQDGVSISRSRGSIVELFDIERVEVAKGPQPTLFGRGALIGGVNIIQAKPDLKDSAGRVTLGYGNYNEYYAEGMLTGPIIEDVLGFRVAGRLRKREGYVESLNPNEDDFNSQDMQALRLSLAFVPSAALRFDLILNWQQDTPSGTSFKSKAFAPAPGASSDPWEPANLNSFGNWSDEGLGLDRTVQSATLIADWEISDALSLTSITATRHFESVEVFDPDGFGLPLFVFVEDAQGDQFSQEFRLNYDAGGRFTGFAGASWLYEDGRQSVPLGFDERALQAFLGGLIVPPNAPAVETLPTINLTAFQLSGGTLVVPLKPYHEEFYANTGVTEGLDLFADGSYALTDRLELTAGLRYTVDDKTSGLEVGFVNGPSALTGAGVVVQGPFAGRLEQGDTFDGFTWRLAAKYTLNDNWNLFANTARGRRPEVISPSATNPAHPFTVLPAETVDSFEAGAKGVLAGGDLLLDGSVFYYNYENFQSSVVDANGLIIPINAGNADSTGIELQANWAPSDMFSLIASYGYNKARFKKTVDGQTQAFGGNPLRLSPDHTASLAGRIRFDTAFGEILLIPSYTWQSQVYFDNTKRDLISEDAYGLANLNLSWTLPDEQVTFEAYVSNLFDEDHIIDAGNTGDAFGIPTFIAGAPRFFGVRATGRF